MRYLAALFLVLLSLMAPSYATPSNLTVEVYTIPGCFGCGIAKSLLEERGIPYTEINLQGRPDLYRQMKERAGGKQEDSMTVPRIFINGKHIGGYSQLGDALDNLKPRPE